jgi:hypothetical protein
MKFNIDAYADIAGRLDVRDLDFGAFSRSPLAPETLRCLRYMHDVELHTVCYLRDLLVTRAHRDPDITTFLTFWSFEEYWHGEAIGRVLDAHGEVAGSKRSSELRRRLGRRDALRPIMSMLSSAVTQDFTAVHMTWGAVNEWTTQAGYARLMAHDEHPVLHELLRRIMRQEGRHIDFYSSEASRRLAASTRAQRMTRFALRHLWSPVGTGIMAPAEVQFLVAHLFDGAEGAAVADRIDRRIDRLPGLSNLHLIKNAADDVRSNRPVRPTRSARVGHDALHAGDAVRVAVGQ